jgi:hypothetical protein
VRAWSAESRYYHLSLDPSSGAVRSLIDKETGTELVDASAPYKLNELLYVRGGERTRIIQDMATLPPAKLEVKGQRSARLVENLKTPWGVRMTVHAEAENVPAIDTEITLHDSMKRIDIVNRIRKTPVRDKEAIYFAFPFRVPNPELAYEIQNTWVRPNDDQLPGACRDWFTTQNAVVARGRGISAAWATPDAPLITLTDINRGAWLEKLEIRNAHMFSYVMNNYWFTNYRASQGGELAFRYFITSGAQLDATAVARFSSDTRSPLVAYPYVDSLTVRIEPAKRPMPAAAASFFTLSGGAAALSTFKPEEQGNGYILRVRETAGQKVQGVLRSPVFPVAAAAMTNAIEEPGGALPVSANGVQVPLAPWQFTTVRLQFASGGARN